MDATGRRRRRPSSSAGTWRWWCSSPREAALRQSPDERLANFGEPGTATEGQAFCLLMEAARQTMSSA